MPRDPLHDTAPPVARPDAGASPPEAERAEAQLRGVTDPEGHAGAGPLQTEGTPLPEPGGDSTPRRVLEAARDLFAGEGYEGASVRAITSRAGVNLGAVTYHFGSKEALYHEVLDAVLGPLRSRILEVCGRPLPPLARIEAAIRAFFAHLGDNPDQPRFMVQQLAVDGPLPAPLLGVMLPVAAALRGVVVEGQADGTIRRGDPFLFVLSTLAQPVYFTLVARKIPAAALPADLRDPGQMRLLVDHVVHFALNGLRAGEAS